MDEQWRRLEVFAKRSAAVPHGLSVWWLLRNLVTIGLVHAVVLLTVYFLLLIGDALFTSYASRLAELALKQGLPSIYPGPFVGVGGLLEYGPNTPQQFQRMAYYVDRILKGAKPADLPVEQPMTFDFVVNLKTAQTLGITFPNEIMLQVTDVIQ